MHGFAQGRMRVNRRFDFFVRRFERDGQAEFADHFRGFGADDVRAQNFAVRFAEKDFHKAVNLADGAGLAARRKRKFADLEFQSLFLRRAFGEADAGDLRLAIGATRKHGDFFRRVIREHAFHRLNRFVAGDVREQRRRR